jgi:ABC-2 type transport system permease protein
VSRPAPLPRATAALAASELRLTLRRGENLLVTIVIPAAVLLFFATTGLVPGIAGPPVNYLLPGALALAVIATGLVNLGIATAYDRQYGVLKRLGGSPLPRTGLVAAKLLAVLAIEIVQLVLLFTLAVGVLGWAPDPSVGVGRTVALLLGGLILGTATFAGLGLLLAGTLRAEATLALANGLFLAFLMLGGIVIPVSHLPWPLDGLGWLLPANALAEIFRGALSASLENVPVAVATLAVWAVATIGLTVRTFRWE